MVFGFRFNDFPNKENIESESATTMNIILSMCFAVKPAFASIPFASGEFESEGGMFVFHKTFSESVFQLAMH